MTIGSCSFNLALGPAMRAIKGHATVEVLAVYSRARELLNDAASSREQMSVLYGLWIAHFTRWDTATRELAQEMIALAERHKDVEARILGKALMGNTHWGTGEFVAARSYLEQSLALCRSDGPNSRISHNHSVAVLSFLGVTLWPLGFPEQAADAAERALAQARQTGHVPLTAMALHNEAFLVASFGVDQRLIGIDPAEAEMYCREHGVAAYEAWARFWQGVIVGSPRSAGRHRDYARGDECGRGNRRGPFSLSSFGSPWNCSCEFGPGGHWHRYVDGSDPNSGKDRCRVLCGRVAPLSRESAL